MMKKLDKKTLILTCIITLLPILLGLTFYNDLPERIAIHWGMNNEPNGWAGKNLFVFAFPIFMVVFQLVCQIGTRKKQRDASLPKLYQVVVWLIPALSVILYIVTLAVALGKDIDIRKVVCLILGIVFIILGNYIPKMSYTNHNMINLPIRPENEHVWRVFSRIMGIAFIGEGFLLLVSLFFPPIASVLAIAIFLGLLIGISFYGSAISGKK